MFEHFAGILNSILVSVSAYGVALQLLTVIRRRRQGLGASSVLSVNQFSMSFLAYLSFFIFGYSLEPVNHYLVWPRLLAAICCCWILVEIYRHRRSTTTSLIAGGSLLLLCIATLVPVIAKHLNLLAISAWSIVCIALMLLQGYLHQLKLIWQSGDTGAVNIRMSQFILMMDASTLLLVLAIGWDKGWPLAVLALSSAMTKLLILYLFRWVRYSPLAAKRRALNQ